MLCLKCQIEKPIYQFFYIDCCRKCSLKLSECGKRKFKPRQTEKDFLSFAKDVVRRKNARGKIMREKMARALNRALGTKSG